MYFPTVFSGIKGRNLDSCHHITITSSLKRKDGSAKDQTLWIKARTITELRNKDHHHTVFCQHVMPWVYFVRVLSQFFQVGLKTLRIMYAVGVGIQTSVLTKH